VAKTGIPETIESKNSQTNKWFFEYTYKLSGNKCVGVFRDITERKLMQQQLELSEKRYKFMLDSLKEGFEIIEVIFDENGKAVDFLYLDVNDEWYRQTGITFNVVGRLAKEAIPGIEDYWLESYGNVAKTGAGYYQKNYNKFTNKSYIVRTFRIDGNICARMVLDVTEKQTEEDDLKINLTKYQVLFNQFPLGITISDRSGHIIEMNEIAREILEVKEPSDFEEIISGKKRNIIRTDGSVLPALEFAGNQALKNSTTISNQELGIITDSGEVKWISATSAPIPLNTYGVATVFKDITDQVKTREVLEESRETLKFLFDTMNEALAIHEVILDKDGKPDDYVFIEVNPAFENQTGIKREKIIGARASQFRIGKETRIKLAEVALTGKPISLEYYNTLLKKNFKIFAFSQAAGQFVTIFQEIDSKKKQERIRT
jgi:PAS domain-containing protein